MESNDNPKDPDVHQPTAEPGNDRLLSTAETAAALGYTYRSWMQARVDGRVLLSEVRTSDGERTHVKYRNSEVQRAVRGEIKAMRAAQFSEEQKRRTHERTKELRKQRKEGGES